MDDSHTGPSVDALDEHTPQMTSAEASSRTRRPVVIRLRTPVWNGSGGRSGSSSPSGFPRRSKRSQIASAKNAQSLKASVGAQEHASYSDDISPKHSAGPATPCLESPEPAPASDGPVSPMGIPKSCQSTTRDLSNLKDEKQKPNGSNSPTQEESIAQFNHRKTPSASGGEPRSDPTDSPEIGAIPSSRPQSQDEPIAGTAVAPTGREPGERSLQADNTAKANASLRGSVRSKSGSRNPHRSYIATTGTGPRSRVDTEAPRSFIAAPRPEVDAEDHRASLTCGMFPTPFRRESSAAIKEKIGIFEGNRKSGSHLSSQAATGHKQQDKKRPRSHFFQKDTVVLGGRSKSLSWIPKAVRKMSMHRDKDRRSHDKSTDDHGAEGIQTSVGQPNQPHDLAAGGTTPPQEDPAPRSSKASSTAKTGEIPQAQN